MGLFDFFKKCSGDADTDRILAPHQVEEMLSDDYGSAEEAVVFVHEQSKPIMPTDLMFLPFMNAEFGKNANLGMVYGTGSGCALIRKTALQTIQRACREGSCTVRTCDDFIKALESEGFSIRQDPKLDLDLLK